MVLFCVKKCAKTSLDAVYYAVQERVTQCVLFPKHVQGRALILQSQQMCSQQI